MACPVFSEHYFAFHIFLFRVHRDQNISKVKLKSSIYQPLCSHARSCWTESSFSKRNGTVEPTHRAAIHGFTSMALLLIDGALNSRLSALQSKVIATAGHGKLSLVTC